jgi:hypothetical protein
MWNIETRRGHFERRCGRRGRIMEGMNQMGMTYAYGNVTTNPYVTITY